MTNELYSVALCTNRNNISIFEPLNPTLIVFSENNLRLFVGQADVFYSESEISDDLSSFLVSIGVKADNQYHVDDLPSAYDVVRIMALRRQLAATEDVIATVKSITNS